MYQNPKVVYDSDLSEGVYMASGAVADPGGGSGTNVAWVERSTEPEHNGDPHWIRKYSLTVPAMYEGKLIHYHFTLHGPVRHAGGHHEKNKRLIGNELDFDVQYSSTHDNYLYVCCDQEYYPEGLQIISGGITSAADV